MMARRASLALASIDSVWFAPQKYPDHFLVLSAYFLGLFESLFSGFESVFPSGNCGGASQILPGMYRLRNLLRAA
jgi:hypothetical protein